MILVATVILLHSAGLAGSMPGGPGVPENITVTFLNPTSVRVSWDTSIQHVEKYDVTYKPTDASFRVVAIVAGNSDAVTLSGLKPDTQYQLTVAAVWRGRKFRSRPIVFRTLEPPRTSPHTDVTGTFATEPPSSTTFSEPPSYVEYPQTSSTVRGVEIGIVLLVLVVWIAAIALFFNRWGKIRMLLPYQPDYKRDQLKVPGTAACAAAVASGNACSHASGEHVCTQLASAPLAATVANSVSATITTAVGAKVIHRPRLNSAIFTSTSGPGFDSKEFFRRHGSQSRLCRKARSVENMSTDNENDDDSMMALESQRYNEFCHHHRHRAHAPQPSLQQQQANSARQHFGLPVLSVSGPSPPEDNDTDSETGRFLK